MKLSQYIKDQGMNKKYRYVGTIWGNESFDFTGNEIYEMLTQFLPDFDGELADLHPAYGHREFDEDGNQIGKFYLESDRICFDGFLVQETVLEERE